MIIFHLKKILLELKVSQTSFAKKANIRPNTINDMCNNQTKRIEIKTLTQVMLTLNSLSDNCYEICDLMEFKEEKIKSKGVRNNEY